MKSPFSDAEWITAEEFADLTAVNIYHKEALKQEKPECPDKLKNFHMITTGKFVIDRVPGKAVAFLTADDYYFLYINGRFVCQGPAIGYPTGYYWNETEVTDFLKTGENEVTMHVYYHGMPCRAYTSADLRQGCIALIKDGDGNCILKTGSDWTYAVDTSYTGTGLIGYNTIYREERDLRKNPKPDEFRPVRVKNPDYCFTKEPVTLLQIYDKQPVFIEALEEGGIFLDFGEEITGTLAFHVSGPEGEKVRIFQGEETDDGPYRVRYKMRCSCDCYDEVIIDGNENDYRQFDYRGFRYAALIPGKGVEISNIRAIVRHYPFDDDFCTLETGNDVLKEVFDICKRSVKYGAQEVFVDCPTREKGQYSGDMTITGASHVILTGDTSLYRKGLEDFIHSSFICPGLMAVAPSGINQEIADYSLQFPIQALFYYRATGDRGFLKQCLEASENILTYFRAFSRPDGLLCSAYDKWNLVDWPKNLRDGYDFDTEGHEPGSHNVLNAFYIGCVLSTEEIREILNIRKEKQSPALIRAFNRAFYNENTMLYTDRENGTHSSLHSNVLPLFFGFANETGKADMLRFICDKGMACGVYMSWFLLKALCKNGMTEEAFRIITDTGIHSWYNMVREGGTTCFEAWGKDQKWNTSLCHPWASGPVSVLFEDILPEKPEYGHIVIKKKNED